MRNAQADLNKLSFKEVRFDIDRLHARFDDLVSTLKAGQTESSMSQQLMCILQACETCDVAKHVCSRELSQNSLAATVG